MRANILVIGLTLLLTGCGNAEQVSFSSMGGGGAGDLSLAPMPKAAPDPEEGLLEGIFFMQGPDDVEVKMPEIAAGPSLSIDNKWDAPLQTSGGIAPKGKSYGGALEAGTASLSGGGVSISPSGPIVEANQDPSAIQAVLRRNAGQVSYCHNIAKSRYSDVAGRVEIAWDIRAGKVEGATVQSNTTGDDRMAACVLGKVMRMDFPDEMSVAGVTHPFVFQKG